MQLMRAEGISYYTAPPARSQPSQAAAPTGLARGAEGRDGGDRRGLMDLCAAQ